MKDLYQVLGLEKGATLSQIKSAYRQLSGLYHPDRVAGMENKFQEVKHAYEVLSNENRRDRYDRTGRDDDIKVTPKVIQSMVEQTMLVVLTAERPDGSTDDPTWEDIRKKILESLATPRRELTQNIKREQKKLTRLDNLAKRFKSKTDADPVGDALAAHRVRIVTEIHKLQDGLELNHKMDEVFRSYDYEIGECVGEENGDETGGTIQPRPHRRLSGPRFLSDLR